MKQEVLDVLDCVLSREEKGLLVSAIIRGLQKAKDFISHMPPLENKENYVTKLICSFVTTEVKQLIAHHSLLADYTATNKVSGHYHYTLMQNQERNMNIIISNLPNNKHIFTPARYRANLCSDNINRILAYGIPFEVIIEDISNNMSEYQTAFPLGKEYLPFGLLLCYDAKLGVGTKVYEGALAPNQEDWLYKIDITKYLSSSQELTPPTTDYSVPSREGLAIKPEYLLDQDEEPMVRLKNT